MPLSVHSALYIILLDGTLFPPEDGWRAAFAIGGGVERDHIRNAALDSGESALAYDPWPHRNEANTIVDGIEKATSSDSEGYVLDDRPIKPVRLNAQPYATH